MSSMSRDAFVANAEAWKLARSLQHDGVRGEHLLAALASSPGHASQALRRLGVDAGRIRQAVESLPRIEGPAPESLPVAPDAAAALDAAADCFAGSTFDTEHLLLALWSTSTSVRALLERDQVDEARLIEAITAVRGGTPVRRRRIAITRRLQLVAAVFASLLVLLVLGIATGSVEPNKTVAGAATSLAVLTWICWPRGSRPSPAADPGDTEELDELERMYQAEHGGT